ncbi:MAG TPA: OmpA family protein [Phycisphaerae bacterium]|nr:OmpA family protein [Phycisphaerae bacterium]
MTWKTLSLFARLSVVVLGIMVMTSGCGPDAKDKKINELNAENDQLKNDLADKDRLLNDAMVRADDARKTIDELNQEMAKLRAAGAGGKEGAWTTFKNFDMIEVPGSVLFESGKADLTSNGRKTLGNLASDIKSRYADRDIYVIGYTDAEPIAKSKWKDNWELGAHRALTVVRALHESGVSYDQLVQANCGEFRPKKVTKSKNVAENRRVEFYAVRRNVAGIEKAEKVSRGTEAAD